jgi:hypothetical protein
MSPDECYWIGAKGGLVKEKHRRCIGDAIWLFLWFLLKQTGVNEAEEGIVSYGHPQTRSDISEKTGFPEWQIKKWIARLRATEYIRTVESAPEGLIIFVQKAKDKTKRRPGVNQDRIIARPGVNQDRGYQIAPTQPIQEKRITLVGGAPIPKNLSYYNKSAAVAVKTLAREKQLPKTKSWEQQKAELRQKGLLQ